MSHTHMLVKGTLSAGLLIAGLSGTATAASPVFTSVCNMTVYVKEPIRLQLSASDADGGTLTYSVSGLPTGASINASTGQFTWQPSLSDTGAHTAAFRVSDGTNQTNMQTIMTVVMPALGADGAMKVLRPNGGESYRYGDTLTIAWVTPTCNLLTNMLIHRKRNATSRYQCWFTPNDGIKPAIDTTGARGGFCYTFADRGMVMNFYRLALTPAPFLSCSSPPPLGGDTATVDSLYIRAFNQYGLGVGTTCSDELLKSALEAGDYTDGFFSVVPRATFQPNCSASAQHRSIRSASLAGVDAGCVGVYSVSGARFAVPGNSTSMRVPAGVYVAKWNVAGHAVTRTIVMSGAGVLPLAGIAR